MSFVTNPNVNPSSLLNKVVPVPTLSTLGFVYDSTNKFDKLFAHAFVADYNQTYLYPGKVTSIPRLFETAGANLNTLQDSVKSGLYAYFNKYYETVDLSISITPDPSNPDSSNVIFQLSITFVENNVPYSIERSKITQLSTMNKLASLNNYGK